jgi:hypothetical protein
MGMELLPVLTPLLQGITSLAQTALPQVLAIFKEFTGEFSANLGPAMLMMQDAWDRIVTAFGGAPEEMEPLDVALWALQAVLDAVVIALQAVAVLFQGAAWAVEELAKVVDTLVKKWEEAKTALSGWTDIKLPDWMTPGSPTPLEMGLRGINSEMGGLVAGANRLSPALGFDSNFAAIEGMNQRLSQTAALLERIRGGNTIGLTLNMAGAGAGAAGGGSSQGTFKIGGMSKL